MLIGLSAGSHFVTDIYQNFYVGLIPFLTAKFDLSLAQVSLLGATSVIANSLFSPLFGHMSDRYGFKYFVIAGPLFSSVFLSILGVISDFWLVLIILFFGNLAIAAFHPSSAAIAGHHGGSRKGFGTSLINFGGIFGGAIGAFLIILIYQKAGIRVTPFLMVFGIMAALLLMKFLPGNKDRSGKKISPNIPEKLKKTNKNKISLIALLIFTIYSLYIVWISLVNYIPLYFTDIKIPIIHIGIILFLFGTAGGLGGFLSGFIYDKFKHGSFIVQTGLLIPVPFLFFSFKTTGFTAILLFIVSGFFLIAIQPICIRMSQDLFPGNMGFASSLILGFSAGLSGITMIFIGRIANVLGIMRLIQSELVILIIAFIMLFFYPYLESRIKKDKIISH